MLDVRTDTKLGVHIGVDADRRRYAADYHGICVPYLGRTSFPALVAHELMGHIFGQYAAWRQTGVVSDPGESYAWNAENSYYGTVGGRDRCGN